MALEIRQQNHVGDPKTDCVNGTVFTCMDQTYMFRVHFSPIVGHNQLKEL